MNIKNIKKFWYYVPKFMYEYKRINTRIDWYDVVYTTGGVYTHTELASILKNIKKEPECIDEVSYFHLKNKFIQWTR